MVDRDVAPEEVALARPLDGFDDVAQESEVHGADAVAPNALRRLTAPELEGLVCAEVNVSARKKTVDLREPLANERHGAGPAGREHVPLPRFGGRRRPPAPPHVVQGA